MNSSADCDYTRQDVEPWWGCCQTAHNEAHGTDEAA